MTVRILQGDCREVLRTLSDASVHSIVTDPPYELTQARPGGRSEATRGKVMGGFMGMKWDGTGVAFDVEMWREGIRVLKPGGHLLAFGGSRTYHRMVCAIEDAGFEIRDQIMWLYGSGFPKSENPCKCKPSVDSGKIDAHGWRLCATCGKQFELGTALKPAHEPIVVARKPLDGTVAANVLAHGCGALNIDASRVLGEEMPPNTGAGGMPRRSPDELRGPGEVSQPHTLGRWPANVIHDGSDEVLAAFPAAPGQIADASTNADACKTQNVYGAMKRGNCTDEEVSANAENVGAVGFRMRPGVRRGDARSAARFFYCAKASKADREAGCDGLPTKRGGMVSNTSGQHITRRDGGEPGERANHHPTVKPTELMRYLVRLVTPPGGTVLDPFAGSGSTGRAAAIESFDAILIELNQEYVEIARKRIHGDAPLFAEVA